MVKCNKSGLENKIKQLEKLNQITITYGIFGEKASQRSAGGGGLPVGVVARIQEEGLRSRDGRIRIPSRPFFTYSKIQIRRELPKIIARQFKLLWGNNNSIDNLLRQIGNYCKQTVINNIRDSSKYTPLSPITVRIKGNDIPLIDSGQMLGSVDYKINKGNIK